MTNEIPGSVIVGVDGSRHSREALTEAIHLARLENRPLHILHAVDPALWAAYTDPAGFSIEDLRESLDVTAEEIVSEALTAASEELERSRISTARVSGDPRHVLVDASNGAAVLVVGARGRGAFRPMTLGSVSTWLSQHAACPLVVARARPSDVVDGVVVGVDGTPLSSAAIEFAFQQASVRKLPLTVVHCLEEVFQGGYGVFNQPDEDLDDLAGHRLAVAESLAGWREHFPDVEVRVELHRGRASTFLAHLSPSPTLLVVGSRHRSRLGALLGGSVSRATVEHATCSVAVVPASESVAPVQRSHGAASGARVP